MRRRGQIVSEFRHPPLQDHPRVRSCGAALGGLSTKWHFVLVTAASGDVPRMYARIPQKELINLRLGRNTCGRISIRPPQNRNVSGAWLDDERLCASFCAQTWERFAKTTPLSPIRMRAARPQPHGLESQLGLAVPELCQNPICLACRELQFEREQLPQVVDIRHFRMESMEGLEPAHILRNQQVAGSTPAGGSIKSISCGCYSKKVGFKRISNSSQLDSLEYSILTSGREESLSAIKLRERVRFIRRVIVRTDHAPQRVYLRGQALPEEF